MVRVVGIVLAAGAGRRMGAPKGLLRHADGRTYAAASAALLRAAGCAEVLVTVGARAAEVRAGLPPGVVAVDVADWSRGPGAGLGHALRHPLAGDADAVLVTLVDLPGLDLGGVRAVLALAGPAALVRAVEGGRPGHPVLVGRDHLARALAVVDGGAGLRGLFADSGPAAVVHVEVPGAAADVDRVGDLPAGTVLP